MLPRRGLHAHDSSHLSELVSRAALLGSFTVFDLTVVKDGRGVFGVLSFLLLGLLGGLLLLGKLLRVSQVVRRVHLVLAIDAAPQINDN